MKRMITVFGILILAGVIAMPVLAHGPKWGSGWGRGGHMMGRGGSPGYCWNEGAYGNLTEDQQTGMEALHKKYYEDTAKIRDDLRDKTGELNTLLDTANPDAEKVRALQREISDLRSKLDQARIEFQLEARKIAPDVRMGQGYGRGYGKGYGRGHGRGGWHHGWGHHKGGYGPGSCWN